MGSGGEEQRIADTEASDTAIAVASVGWCDGQCQRQHEQGGATVQPEEWAKEILLRKGDVAVGIAEAIRASVLAEREACARLCAATQTAQGAEMAEAIRARNRIRGTRA
jgi:hypothetical protein